MFKKIKSNGISSFHFDSSGWSEKKKKKNLEILRYYAMISKTTIEKSILWHRGESVYKKNH